MNEAPFASVKEENTTQTDRGALLAEREIKI
jgi:hypothetical protein